MLQTRRSLALAPLFSIVLILAMPYAKADGTVDQANTPAWRGGAVNMSSVNKVRQSFTPSMPCLLAIDAAIVTGNMNRGGDTLTLAVPSESPGLISSTSTQTVPEGFNGYRRFDLSPPLLVTPGKRVTFGIADTKIVFFWKYAGNNPYSAGQAFFYGAPFGTNDFLFRTYGAPTGGFDLSLSPDTLTLDRSNQKELAIKTPPESGHCTGPVGITITGLPSGVVAQPAQFTISSGSGRTTLKASQGATIGTFHPTMVARSGNQTKTQSFTLIITAPPPAIPRITQISPTVQLPGQGITIMGTGFDANCVDTVSFDDTSLAPNPPCSATSLNVSVPSSASYGATMQVSVRTIGGISNAVPLKIARQPGESRSPRPG